MQHNARAPNNPKDKIENAIKKASGQGAENYDIVVYDDMPTTLTGEVERITYESDATGFRVLKIGSLDGPNGKRGTVTVVGTLPPVGMTCQLP